MKFLDETQTTTLFEFTDLSSGTGQLQLGSLDSNKTIVLQKNETTGSKGFITHKRGIKNRQMTFTVLMTGSSKETNRAVLESLIDNQTTIYLDAESDSKFTHLEGLYDFDNQWRESISPRRDAIVCSFDLFENRN